MEENTSKVYVGPSAGLLSGQLAAANGAGSALFVINLCASMAPVPLAGKTLPGLDNYRLYQVSRVEDGRTRYRLRLGFFPSEADAVRVLATVREKYPTAFAACLRDEDRKFARGYLPDSASLSDTQIQRRPVALVVETPRVPAAPAPAPQAAATAQPKPQPARTAVPPAPKVADALAVAKVAAATATAKVTAAPAAAPTARAFKPAASPNAPVGVQTLKVAATEVEIELSWEPPSLPAKTSHQPQPPAASAPVTIAPVFTTETVIKAKAEVKAPPVANKPVKNAAAAKTPVAPARTVTPVELTLAAERAADPQREVARAKPSTTPFHVGKGVEIPAGSLSLAAETPQPAPVVTGKAAPTPSAPALAAPAKKDAFAGKPTIKPTPVVPAKELPKREPVAAMSKLAGAAPVAAVTSPPPVRRPTPHAQPPGIAAFAAELDSTQTIRALTNDELSDASQEKWFAIQLAISEQPVNLDAMPHLDIFEAYRLYSVASAGSGKIVHSLRLGFFREAVSADAVGGYLKTFFPNPSVLRISAAEQLRFKDAPAPRAHSAEPKNEAKVVDLSDARQRAAKPVVPTVTMEVATPPRQNATADRSPTGTHRINASGSYKLNATGTHKLNSTGTHKLNATGTHKLNSSGLHKVSATGTHRALQPAAKNGGPASRHSAPMKNSRTSASGKFRAVAKKSLADQLLDEAREVELSESGIRKLPKNDSLLARWVDKLKK